MSEFIKNTENLLDKVQTEEQEFLEQQIKDVKLIDDPRKRHIENSLKRAYTKIST